MRRLLVFLSGVFLALPCALRADTVLVIPFFNQSHSPNLDWIGESIAEAVRESLSSEGVLVLNREDRLEAYRRLSLRPNAVLTHASVMKVGDTLDAAQVIYGTYKLVPSENPESGSRGSLHITARILNLKRTRQGPEFEEIGVMEDLAAREIHLGWQALQFLAPKTAPSEAEFRQARPAVRLDAKESYIRGLIAVQAEQKHRFFTQAARLDERFSQPCYQLGRMHWDRKDYAVAAQWLSRVTHADSHYLESLFLLGLCRYHLSDFAGAQKNLEAVAVSVPLNEVYNNLGAAQSRRNLLAEAAENFRKALEGDNADPDYHFNLGYTFWKSGKFADAEASFRAALERNPNDAEARDYLARAQRQQGQKPGELKAEGRERLKTNYEETAYRQLKAELETRK